MFDKEITEMMKSFFAIGKNVPDIVVLSDILERTKQFIELEVRIKNSRNSFDIQKLKKEQVKKRQEISLAMLAFIMKEAPPNKIDEVINKMEHAERLFNFDNIKS